MLKKLVAKGLLKYTPDRIRELFFDDWKRRCFFRKFEQSSFSQEGEDRVLSRLLEDQSAGFFVDIGAHHPFRFSNTYLFYLAGWRGINIEARPGSKVLFDKYREQDINLEIGVSQDGGTLEYFEMSDTALNTFCQSEALFSIEKGTFEMRSKKEIETKPLRVILDEYLPPNKVIDFMSIDVEGMDFDVLKSNDWERYRPIYLLVEALRCEMLDITKSQIGGLLESKGYAPISKTVNTFVFKDMAK